MKSMILTKRIGANHRPQDLTCQMIDTQVVSTMKVRLVVTTTTCLLDKLTSPRRDLERRICKVYINLIE